jgi:hypothetical protein
MEVAQKVFPTVVTGNDNPIPADAVDPNTGAPTTGDMKRFATVQYPFTLSPLHISDPSLAVATNQVNLAGQAVALADDSLLFFGVDAALPPRIVLPGGPILRKVPDPAKKRPFINNAAFTAVDQTNLAEGLIGLASSKGQVQRVELLPQPAPPAPPVPPTWGLNTYNAVLQCIMQFVTTSQGPPYAVILSPRAFADANIPIAGNPSVSPANIIQSVLLSGPFVASAGMVMNSYDNREVGLVASLGGRTTTLYVGTAPMIEFNTYMNSVYSFDVRESIQFVNIDPRSLIKLDFAPAP